MFMHICIDKSFSPSSTYRYRKRQRRPGQEQEIGMPPRATADAIARVSGWGWWRNRGGIYSRLPLRVRGRDA